MILFLCLKLKPRISLKLEDLEISTMKKKLKDLWLNLIQARIQAEKSTSEFTYLMVIPVKSLV